MGLAEVPMFRVNLRALYNQNATTVVAEEVMDLEAIIEQAEQQIAESTDLAALDTVRENSWGKKAS